MNSPDVIIYTDGSSLGNPGPGGFGTILISGKKKKELAQGFRHTTNNRMELMAVIAGLEELKKENLHVAIYSDSKYVVDAVAKGWLTKWIASDFKGGKKNKDLWLRFFHLSKKNQLRFHWIKGHSTNMYNNHCDELATSAGAGKHLVIDVGYEDLKGIFL